MSNNVGPMTPLRNSAVVATSDSADLSTPCRAILLEGDGVVHVDMEGTGTNVKHTLLGGVWHPMRVTRIYTTGFTGTAVNVGW